ESINGALAQADILGIFGQEGLDMANLWGSVETGGACAFRMYRNYDGAGGQFGDTSVTAVSSDRGQLAVYAARRGSDSATTIMVINKTLSAQTGNITLTGIGNSTTTTAQVYRYSGDNLAAIVRDVDQAVGATGFSATLPASSITLFVIKSAGGNNCAASVSSSASTSLVVHIPVITYNGSNFWADLQYHSAGSTLTVVNAGIVSDASPFNNCTASTLTSDFKLHIPVIIINGVSYRLDLQYNGSAFEITGIGTNGTTTTANAGLIYKNRHGKYSFAVPLLDMFISRQNVEGFSKTGGRAGGEIKEL
ncbi:MAG: hypothetical protein HQK89_16710, partial [Nitrospirae bacterium]|nr:hypothetical protein [Nitrospirota bacterium]